MRIRQPILRHPKEFAYTPIDVDPLINAAVSGNWEHIKMRLDEGYSLSWIDPMTNKSAMRLIAEQSSPDIVAKLLEYSRLENGETSSTHEFIKYEAAGKDAERRLRELNITYESYPVTPSTVFHLYASFLKDETYEILKAILFKTQKSPNDYIAAAVRAAATVYGIPTDGLNHVYEVLPAILFDRCDDEIARISIAEAAACGHEDWAFHLLKILIKQNHPDLDLILGETIVSAARRGRGDLIFDVCERAKKLKVDRSPRFLDMLATASGAALVSEHFSLAKVIMLMVPHFKATPADMEELKKWPESKVARMFKAIRSYKMFTDIAMHSGLTKEVHSMQWSRALKKEYDLKDMSDEGFDYLIHDVEAMRLLFVYRPALDNQGKPVFDRSLISEFLATTKNQLAASDVVVFMNALTKARADHKIPGKHCHFFRLRQFLDEHSDARLTPDDERACMAVKREMAELLRDDMCSLLPKKRGEAKALYEALLDKQSLQMIKKTLDKETTANPKSFLIAKCKEIFNKHQKIISVGKVRNV